MKSIYESHTKQVLMLYEIVTASLPIANNLAFSREDRRKLVEEIMNQQDNEELVDFK